MKKIKIKIYQKIADSIIIKIKNAKSKAMVNRWYNLGMTLNDYCVAQEIYLD